MTQIFKKSWRVTLPLLLFLLWLNFKPTNIEVLATYEKEEEVCVQPTPTPENTPTPTYEPSPTPTNTPTPTPTPTVEVTPTTTPTPTSHPTESPKPPENPPSPHTPTCDDPAPNKAPDNFHVYRNGDQAKPIWFFDASLPWKVIVYYGLVDQGDQHSAIFDNNESGTAVINGLGTRDFSFSGQFLNGCAGGPRTQTVVDGNTSDWILYR